VRAFVGKKQEDLIGVVKLNQERNLEGLKKEEKAELEARVGGLGATGF